MKSKIALIHINANSLFNINIWIILKVWNEKDTDFLILTVYFLGSHYQL